MEERIFSWSLDGFGSALFRIREDGREHFVNRYSSMEPGADEEKDCCDEVIEYDSFEEFWKAFTEQPSWLRFPPVFVHDDYKPFLRDFFSKLDQASLALADQFRLSLWLHKIES